MTGTGRSGFITLLAILLLVAATGQVWGQGPVPPSPNATLEGSPEALTSSIPPPVIPDRLLDGDINELIRSDQPIIVLDQAPLGPEDREFPINLATALRLSDARPLIVAASQASVWVAEAQLTKAKVLWVPTLLLGVDYIRHDGGGPDFNRGTLTAPSANFFYAGGSFIQFVNLTDVYYEPLVARQVLSSKHWDLQSSKNDALLLVADRYFDVHQHRGNYAGALYCVERGRELVDRIERLSRDLVPRIEAERIKNLLADLEQDAVLARQAWRVSSADLTQILRLDPRAVVTPLEPDHLQVTLIDPALPLDALMPIALSNRPELASHQALIRAAATRVSRERKRPFLPIVMLNGFQSAGMIIQAGIFGLGQNNSLDEYTGRSDISIQLIWQLEGLGFGNQARIKKRRGQESEAVIDFFKIQDSIAAEVTEAQAQVQSAFARTLEANRALRAALITYEGNVEGIEQTSRFDDVLVLVNRPEEAVYALELLFEAFEAYFTSVADYNRAQFALFHALGYPAHQLSVLNPPGELIPVDTTRPSYLPGVGNGPPPATR